MNEIDAKISSRNPVLIAQVVARLVEEIRKKYKNDLKQVPEYRYLTEKCVVNSRDISKVAAKAVVELVKSNVLPYKAVLDDFILKIFANGDLFGVVYVLHNLLVIDKNRTSDRSYETTISGHPLVQILERNNSFAADVLNKIKEDSLRNYRLLLPVYFYIFNESVNINELTRQRLWLHILKEESCTHVETILKWMQVSEREFLSETSEYLLQYTKRILKTEDNIPEGLVLYAISILSEILRNQLNPSDMTSCIREILERNSLKVGQNCALYLLVDCITKTSTVYLEDLLSLSLTVLNFGNINNLILGSLKSSVLPWLLYPCFLSEHAKESANRIIQWQSTNTSFKNTHLLLTDSTFLKLKNSNPNLILVFNLCSLCESWSNTNDVTHWLEELEKTPRTFQTNIFPFLLALFMEYFHETNITIKCLNILVQNIQSFKDLTNNLLILLLYKLPSTKNSILHLEILKTLPKLTVREENVVLVRLTVESLSKSSRVLKNFSMSLMFEMWKNDNKFYGHLEKILAEPQETPDWEYYVNKSFILKEICVICPDLYGKDMVPHLSKILNECTSPAQETPSALAIEGIKTLCRAGIVDLITTWNLLSVLYKDETRPLVIQSLCELLEEVPTTSSKNETYYKFIEEVITKLWEFVTMSNQIEVIGSALKTLSCFNLEDISRFLPDIYRVGEKPSDDLLFENAPGLCWIKFLENGNYAAMREMGDFLISFVKLEVTSYTKATYTVAQQQREPLNYNYLPQHSIVRAIGTYLQSEIGKWKGVHKPVYLECLRIFSEEYSKPLPPFTWSFLQELIHEQEARKFSVTIACHQVILSGTARRLIENFLVALTEVCTDDEDIIVIYKNLKHLCNSIQPVILRPFLVKSLNRIFTSKEIFFEVIQCLKNVLKNDTIQEANKQVISEILLNNVEQASKNDDIFSAYLSCVLLLPQNQIEQISSPKKYENISLGQFEMCVKIRCCAVAEVLSKAPLDLIKELFYATGDEKKRSILLKEIDLVLKNQKNKVVNSTWITDLLGQIQTIIAEEEKFSPHLELFFDVLILSVVIFAGYNVFVEHTDFFKMRYLFPAALAAVVKTTYFNHQTLQIIEWLHYVVRLQFLPEYFKIMALECLVNLREEQDFRKNARWKKYICNELLFDNK